MLVAAFEINFESPVYIGVKQCKPGTESIVLYKYRYAGKVGDVYAEPRKSRVGIVVCPQRAISGT